MKQNIIYIGLDVDDTQYHGAAFNKDTGEVVDFKSRPTLKGLLQQLDRMARHFKGYKIKLCYEASYIGYCLQRDLISNGIHCDIVSPSSIPSPRGKAIKTDRIDAGYLAQFYANDLLTIVQPPDEEQEQDRDLLRSRQKVMQQRNQLRKHLQAVLRRSGLHYKAETGHKSHWTKIHYFWLARTIDGLSGSLKVNLELLLCQLKGLNEILTGYRQQIEELANSPRYREPVQSLTCYKGVKNIFALTMITEIGDIKRFSHPRKLVSWIGMDIREYSSGGKHNRMGITKHGNRYLRTAFIEANQRGYRTARIGKDVKARRKDIAPELIHIADRCLRRLNKKGNRLLLVGKHPNKVELSPDGKWILFWEERPDDRVALVRVPVGGGPPESVSGVSVGDFHCPSSVEVSSDCVLGVRGDGNQFVFYALNPVYGLGRELVSIEVKSFFANWDLSPDGERIALVHNDGRLRIITIEDGGEREIQWDDWAIGEFVTWSPDGSSVIVDGLQHGTQRPKKDLLNVSLETDEVHLLRREPNQWHVQPIISPDGLRVAFGLMVFSGNAWMIEQP